MQLPRRVARAIAILAAGAMVLAGLLALRHETLVAHVQDRATGALHHAQALAELHEQGDAFTPEHLHGLDAEQHPDTGLCPLHQGLEASTILPSTPHLAALHVATSTTLTPLVTVASVAQAIYRLAPKTSPPARALG